MSHRRAAVRGTPLRRLAAACGIGALVLVGCSADPEEVDGEPEDEAAIGDPGEGIERPAPEPTGEQMTQEEMAETLRSELDDPTIRTTDDLLDSLREIETELRRLEVDPMECQAQVLSSGAPVPDGALVVSAVQSAVQRDGSEEESDEDAGAEDPGAQDSEAEADEDDTGDSDPGEPGAHVTSGLTATFYSYPQPPTAERYLQTELSGLESCEEYTVTRTVDDVEVQTELASALIDVDTGADEALARTLTASGADGEEHSLAVMVRREAQLITLVEPMQTALDEAEAEEEAQRLQDQAAQMLGMLVDEDLRTPEDDGEENDEDADEDEDTSDED